MTQNGKAGEDLRVRRTRKLLTQAMIELTVEKGFATITVQNIVDRAMVNRATFYRHYLDKYDLLDKYLDDVYELTASQEAAPLSQNVTAGITPVGLIEMFTHMHQHANFYRAMFGSKGDPAFMQRVQQYSEQRLRSLMPATERAVKPDDPPPDLCLSYVSHAGIGVLNWWLNAGQAYTPEQIAAWLSQLNNHVLAHLMLQQHLHGVR